MEVNHAVDLMPPELWAIVVSWLQLNDRLNLRATCKYIRQASGMASIMPVAVQPPRNRRTAQLLSFLANTAQYESDHLNVFGAQYMFATWEPLRPIRVAVVDNTNVISFLHPWTRTTTTTHSSVGMVVGIILRNDKLLVLSGDYRNLRFAEVDVNSGNLLAPLNIGFTWQPVLNVEFVFDAIYSIMARNIFKDQQNIYFATQGWIGSYCYCPSQILYFGLHQNRGTTIMELDLITRAPAHPILRVGGRVVKLLYREVEQHAYLIVVYRHGWSIVHLTTLNRVMVPQWESKDTELTCVEEIGGLLLVCAWDRAQNLTHIYWFTDWWIPAQAALVPHTVRDGKIVGLKILPNTLLLLTEGAGLEALYFV